MGRAPFCHRVLRLGNNSSGSGLKEHILYPRINLRCRKHRVCHPTFCANNLRSKHQSLELA